jgi:hypothetical protein
MDFASFRRRLLNPAEHPPLVCLVAVNVELIIDASVTCMQPARSCHSLRFDTFYWATSAMITKHVSAVGSCASLTFAPRFGSFGPRKQAQTTTCPSSSVSLARLCFTGC